MAGVAKGASEESEERINARVEEEEEVRWRSEVGSLWSGIIWDIPEATTIASVPYMQEAKMELCAYSVFRLASRETYVFSITSCTSKSSSQGVRFNRD